ncbi:MAG: PIG-L deacetylase family protein [Terriglobia bacterium]|jgi:LmbE family N-acetylglucosaminyl deacetylase
MPSTILAIAAHPGDALFTMGATVAQHIANGGQGAFLSLSLGERGHKTIPPKQYGEMQRAATEKAASLLAAETAFLTYPDAEVPLNDEASLAVCDAIRKFKPAIVVTHWSGSWHKDHQNCHGVVRDAVFYAGLAAIERQQPAHNVGKLFFAENWEDIANFQADTYLDISPIYEKWLKACDQFPMWRGETGFRYNDYYRSLAVMRGCLAGFQYAVALMSSAEQREQRVRSL